MRVVVVGCGKWGRNHVRNHAEIGTLAGIVDERLEVAAEFSQAYGVPALTFEQVLADPAVDGVVFALPPSLNLTLGRRVIEAGKHLFVEKPLGLSVRDGEALCQVAETRDRRLMVGHILRYHPAYRELARLVGDGRLGRLLSIVSTRLDLGRIRREEDALWALSPHDVSMVLGLAGEEPASVGATGSFLTHPGIADATSVDLTFPGGLRAEIRASWLHPVKEQRLVVVGSRAMAVFDDREPWESKLVVHGYRVDEAGGAPSVERADPAPVVLEPREPLREECLHFLRCIASGDRPLTDGREGLRVLGVLERASAALAAGRVPPEPEPARRARSSASSAGELP